MAIVEFKEDFRGNRIRLVDESYLWKLEKSEVIGNIYENPELLTTPPKEEDKEV